MGEEVDGMKSVVSRHSTVSGSGSTSKVSQKNKRRSSVLSDANAETERQVSF